MARNISSKAGRSWLMISIAACFVGAVLCLMFVSRGGAIGSKNLTDAFFKILGFYIPLLTLVATFFFRDNQGGTSSKTPKETFYVALFITILWVLTPIFLMLSLQYIEEILSMIDRLTPLGQSLALMALGYYFTKRPDKEAAKPSKGEA
jgi:hypothetical protein